MWQPTAFGDKKKLYYLPHQIFNIDPRCAPIYKHFLTSVINIGYGSSNFFQIESIEGIIATTEGKKYTTLPANARTLLNTPYVQKWRPPHLVILVQVDTHVLCVVSFLSLCSKEYWLIFDCGTRYPKATSYEIFWFAAYKLAGGSVSKIGGGKRLVSSICIGRHIYEVRSQSLLLVTESMDQQHPV